MFFLRITGSNDHLPDYMYAKALATKFHRGHTVPLARRCGIFFSTAHPDDILANDEEDFDESHHRHCQQHGCAHEDGNGSAHQNENLHGITV